MAELRGQLPAEPWVRRPPAADGKVHFSVVELKPQAADDYVAQADSAVGSTQDVALWKAQHLGVPFRDRRFSRAGETYCYLKMDGSQVPDDFPDRGEIEEALLDVLEEPGLGVSIGGGTGLLYSYIELALTDVARAMAAMRPILQAKQLPRRSWLLFWDECLAAEWIPVWDDAPAPPR